MKRLKVGIIGLGSMGKNHLRVLSMLKNIDLKFIYDIDSDQIKSLGDNYEVHASKSLENDLQEIDAAIITTPTSTHYDYIKLVSRYVDNIFVEKPLTESLSTTQKVLELAKEKSLKIQVGFIERFNPAIVALKKVINNTEQVINFDITRTNKLSSRIKDVDVVTDMMIHDIDLALHFNGKVESVEAYGVMEDNMIAFARATLKHENGSYSNLTASRITEKRIRQIFVTCKDMFIDCNLLSKEVFINKQTLVQSYKEVSITSKQETINVKPGEALLSELLSFTQYIQGEDNDSSIPTAEAGLMAMEIAQNIQEQI
ncbi:MAG: Gfo/Idh/MocA family oxidoreductase [Pseudomonadota bacterium]